MAVQGRWLTFKIETFDQQGNRKTRGGDSWYVVLRDVHQKLMYSTRVFDDGDGTYTVAAIIHQPGTGAARKGGRRAVAMGLDSGTKELQGKGAAEHRGCGGKRAAGWQSWAIGQLGNRFAIMDSGTTWVTGQQSNVIRAAVMGNTAAAMDDKALGQ